MKPRKMKTKSGSKGSSPINNRNYSNSAKAQQNKTFSYDNWKKEVKQAFDQKSS